MEPLSNVFCSIQRALLGHVTANLRAVYVIVDEESQSYNLFFYYDKPLSEDEAELASLADTEFIADFPLQTTCTVEVLPYPQRIINKGWCVYERYEPKAS